MTTEENTEITESTPEPVAAAETAAESTAAAEAPAPEAAAPTEADRPRPQTPSDRPAERTYGDRSAGPSGPRRRQQGKYRQRRRKVCTFCVEKVDKLDWKNIQKLRKFQTERGKIVSRRTSGTCARHQRQVTTAIHRARHMALLPYVAE